MSEFYTFNGKIDYRSDGWIIVLAPNSIVNYYKSVIEKLIWKKLTTPIRGGHLTLLPAKHNGDFRNHPNWKKHHGEIVECRYSPIIYSEKIYGPNRYFWLKCECGIIPVIRKEFGLNPNLLWPIHLTVAYLGY